jgi:hypothetical protein
MFAKMFKVPVTHQIAYTRWIRANVKGYWRVCFNDDVDNYFFIDEESADKFQLHVDQLAEFIKDSIE